MPTRQTIQQQRASFAWDQISRVRTQAAIQPKYGTWARKLPALIQINGLGATMAFLLAKAKGNRTSDGYGVLYANVSQWIVEYFKRLKIIDDRGPDDLMEFVVQSSTEMYRMATTEAIEYGMWLRRYVEAEGWGSAEGDDQGEGA